MIYLLCVMGGAVFGATLMCVMIAAGEYDRMEERKEDASNR